MTRKEIAASQAESATYRARAMEAQQRHARHLASGEEGNEAGEPYSEVRAVQVTGSFVDGREIPLEVYDVKYGDQWNRFADRASAMNWILRQRREWKRVHLGDVNRRKLRARVKAEFRRVSDMDRSYGEYLPEQQRALLHGAQVVLAELLLSIAPDGEVAPALVVNGGAIDRARATIDGEEAAARTARRDLARKARQASRAGRGAE